eukprot:TRINITY_DN2914_c0_g1_i1.p2 TRINITY_DN2914_c0_g1~~TRINITY_DN2914_c0_g1_i1.p2  ORF type:complete len:179 (-),score=25.62 TRINITY_DN2914_c0_g1_i1:310-846(-)
MFCKEASVVCAQDVTVGGTVSLGLEEQQHSSFFICGTLQHGKVQLNTREYQGMCPGIDWFALEGPESESRFYLVSVWEAPPADATTDVPVSDRPDNDPDSDSKHSHPGPALPPFNPAAGPATEGATDSRTSFGGSGGGGSNEEQQRAAMHGVQQVLRSLAEPSVTDELTNNCWGQDRR